MTKLQEAEIVIDTFLRIQEPSKGLLREWKIIRAKLAEVQKPSINSRYATALEVIEARETNTGSPKLPCPNLDNVGGCCKKVGHTACTCDYVNRQLRASAALPTSESLEEAKR